MGTAKNLYHRGLEPEDIRYLIEAHSWLAGLANRDCDCYLNDEDSRLKNPCDVCQARRAMDSIGQVIDPRPLTLHPGRLTNEAERIYFELWEKENVRRAHINGGFTTIEWILCPPGQKRPQPVAQRDMTIATTVIQWLGTNCGRCFVERAEKEIATRCAERRSFGTHAAGCAPDAWKERVQRGSVYAAADSIASEFIGGQPELASVRDALRAAIIDAIVAFRKRERDQCLQQLASG